MTLHGDSVIIGDNNLVFRDDKPRYSRRPNVNDNIILYRISLSHRKINVLVSCPWHTCEVHRWSKDCPKDFAQAVTL